MKDAIALLSLVISLVAISISFLTYRRAREREARESRATALDLALSAEFALSVMYTNLLTLDKSVYRPVILDTLARVQLALPKLISSARDIRERIESETDLNKLHELMAAIP
jgi:hypothetical protein